MITRRGFLKLGAAAVLCTAAAKSFGASPERTLSLYNIHTGESLFMPYWADGGYIEASLGEIDHVLRDFRTGEAISMDRRLLDLLHAVGAVMGGVPAFHVVSGYRSPATNAYLAGKSGGVARKSLHMKGQAVDIFLPDGRLDVLHRVALGLGLGGVGYYPGSNFVHVDVGPVRSWNG